MNFNIVSKIHVPFDHNASGGSEEYHIELARRLAARGHDVVSYAPLPQAASRGTFDGVHWRDLEELDARAPGFWLIQRDPIVVTRFAEISDSIRRTQYLAFAAHDVDYAKIGNDDWTSFYATIFADSGFHANYLKGAHPGASVLVGGVGPCLDRVSQIQELVRDPKRLIWASSYVRGLDALLTIYERALEWIPDLKLDVCYGWESIDVAIPSNPSLGRFKENLNRRMEYLPGVTHLGRLGRDVNVWERYTRAGLWCYPTEWPETACQAAMIAQCFGAIPISTSTWALQENVRHGVLLHGYPYTNRLVRATFVQELLRLASNETLQDEFRRSMVPDARSTFHFDRVVDRIEKHALENSGLPEVATNAR